MLICIYCAKLYNDEQILDKLYRYVNKPYKLQLNNNKLKRRSSSKIIDIPDDLYINLKSLNPSFKIERIIESIITNKGDELYYGSILFADKNSWQREIITPVGRIDGFSLKNKKIVELKFISGWKSALGQVLSYSYFYPTFIKEVWLLEDIKLKTKDKDTIVKICKLYDVNVEFISI